MKKIISATLTCLMLGNALTSCISNPDIGEKLPDNHPETEEIAVLSDIAYSDDIPFEGKLAAALNRLSDGSENTVYSPLSVYMVLSMLRDGAAGETKAELDRLLSVDEHSDPAAYCKELLLGLSELTDTNINISNSIWVDDSFTPRREYTDALFESYLAESYTVDLPKAEKRVNSYIKDKTNGLIKNMLSDDALDDAVMALINTVCLDAEWMSPFKAESTHKREFTSADGKVKSIDFMYKNETYINVIDTEDALGITLSYRDERLAFAAVMPKDANVKASELNEKILSEVSYKTLADNAAYESARLYIPSFEIDYSPKLDSALKSIGLRTAYTTDADFTKIAEELLLDSVKTKAVIRVDEKGTKAAAVTVGLVGCTSAAPVQDPRVIDFNRPFAYAVFDTDTGAVLFTGEFVSP